MFSHLRPALVFMAVSTVTLGLLYPFAMTGLGQAVFSAKANGSLIERDGELIGSRLIGQNFAGEGYFHPRPSYAGDGYAGDNSSGSNLAPTNAELVAAITERAELYSGEAGGGDVPVDLVTASGSGLDPHISPAAAQAQAARVAAARGMSEAQLRRLIAANTEGRTFGLLGEPRVNVLLLNLALDEAAA